MSSKIITLELTQELHDLNIVKDLFFEPDTTQNFVLELNIDKNDLIIIFHYYKDWTRTKRSLKEALIEKKVQELHIKAILDTLDANYHTITASQENYNRDDYDPQEKFQKESSRETKKDEKEGEKKKRTCTINKYSQGIPLAESILINNIPYFLQINQDKKPVFSNKISLLDIDIVPPEKTEYLSREYSFESEEEVNRVIELAKKETLDSLFQKVKGILKKYIDMDDDFINILSADVIFTFFQDKLGMTHYILIIGDNNTGKSNILLVFSLLGYRAILDTAITPANIYNFGSQLEEGQNIIIEDELGDIDEQSDKKKMYQVSYRTGTKVTRMYENNNSTNNKNKSSRQHSFFLFCYKMFASEKMPDKIKSKGFLERVIPLKVAPGNPLYDIAEIVDDSGDEEFKELNQELMDTRKVLLMYRLLHHNGLIPNVKLNIKNRYKQLTKPVIRLFQNTKSLNDILKSLSNYVIEKNEEKINSPDSVLLFFIIDLVSEYGTILYNNTIWNEIKKKYPAGEVDDKSYSWFVEGYGIISKTKITNTCETRFLAKQHKDPDKGRGLIFNQKTLNKLAANYSIIDGIKIIKENEEEGEKEKKYNSLNTQDTYDTYDTFIEGIEQNNQDNSVEDSSKSTASLTSNGEEEEQQKNHDSKLKIDENNIKKANTHSTEVSYVSYLSYDTTNANQESSYKIPQLTTSKQSTALKIQSELFRNPLISESDLAIGGPYDPEVINNINRVHPNSDHWFCNNCTMRGDKWFMMKHHCKKM
jgi:hypothetical protein